MPGDLHDFLRACRARLHPSDVGLVTGSGPARRVPGLRRDEVAVLAGISSHYYTRFEQGRTGSPGASVVRSIGEALRLDAVERDYLGMLVAAQVPSVRARAVETPRAERVRAGARGLLDAVTDAPAMILGRGDTVLGMNRLARELFFDVEAVPAAHRNLARWTILDPVARERYRNWEQVARDTAAALRMQAARAHGDPAIARLIDELRASSATFRADWDRHEVFECAFGRKLLRHPLVGDFELDYENLDIPGSPGQHLKVFMAPAGSRAADALATLAAGSVSAPLRSA